MLFVSSASACEQHGQIAQRVLPAQHGAARRLGKVDVAGELVDSERLFVKLGRAGSSSTAVPLPVSSTSDSVVHSIR